jgi:outer membrane lipoprotein SlyB
MRRCFRAIAAVLALAVSPQSSAQPAGAQPVPDGGASVVMRCRDCGVIQSVREVQKPREGAVGGAGPMGFVVYIPIGPGREKAEPYVGSVGNREWQDIATNTSYEFAVRMDDGDFRLIRRDGPSNLQVGERVRVRGDHIERWQP